MNTKRQLISSGTKWEATVGYSRAIRVGNVIEVAGTTAVDGEEIVGKGNVYLQTKFVFQKIEKVLKEAGGSLNDVIRTRLYLVDITKWEEAGRAHGEFFKEIRPVSTMVEVSALIHPDLLVEVEVTAILIG